MIRRVLRLLAAKSIGPGGTKKNSMASGCGALLIMPRPPSGCHFKAEYQGFFLRYCLFQYKHWFLPNFKLKIFPDLTSTLQSSLSFADLTCQVPTGSTSNMANMTIIQSLHQKSVNLYYNTLGRWVAWTIVPPSDGPIFQQFLKNSSHNYFHYFTFFYNLKKVKSNYLSTL